MKSLLLKELRENAKWALLALIVLFLASFYALSLTNERQDYSNSVTLCHSTFLIVTSFGFATFGAALGCLQILPESKRDQWAALLHRPLSPWKILLAKALVGIFLYALATLLPLAACVVYVATPGNFASPFVPAMVLPAVSDWCVGLCFYSLSLLICLQSGRWWGMRGVLAVAGAAIFAIHLLPRWPFALPLLAFLIFLLAACGAIIAPRRFKRRPVIFRWVSVAAVFLGCYGLLALLVAGKELVSNGNTFYSFSYTGYVVAPDGQLLYGEQTKDKNTLFDMAGQDVTAKYLGAADQQRMQYFNSLAFLPPKGGQWRVYLAWRFNRSSYFYAQPVYLPGNQREAWFYLHETRSFIGYDKLTKQCLGICDREGFKDFGAPVVPFPENSFQIYNNSIADSVFYCADESVFRINFVERGLALFFDASPGKVRGLASLGTDGEKADFFALALEDSFLLLDKEGKQFAAIPYPLDAEIWNDLSIAMSPSVNRIFLQCKNSYRSLKEPPRDQYVYVYDLSGNVLATYSHPSAPPPPPSEWSEVFRLAHIAVSPPALLAALRPIVPHDSWRIYGSFPTVTVTWANLAFLSLGTFFLGMLTFFLAKRQGRTTRDALLWAVFVFLLGLPALLTYRLTSGWPVRVRCPQCARKRDLARPTCSSCDAPWPVPAPSGSELLEPLAVPQG